MSFDGTHYRKELEEIGIREFYEKMVEKKGVYPKSSLPSVQDYLDVFLPLAKENIPMLVICISTKLSGSMQSALSARQLVLEDYPDARIRVIDSTYCTVLQGLLALEAASMQERGAGFDETADRIEAIRKTGRIFFYRGKSGIPASGRTDRPCGRRGRNPSWHPACDHHEGRRDLPFRISRSRKKTLDRTVALLKEYVQQFGGTAKKYSLAAGFGFDGEEAESYRRAVVEQMKGWLAPEDLPPLSDRRDHRGAYRALPSGAWDPGAGVRRQPGAACPKAPAFRKEAGRTAFRCGSSGAGREGPDSWERP